MAVLNTAPTTVDVNGYAGDTLPIAVTVPADLVAGRVFTAQVRLTTDAAAVDAVFAVTAPVADPGDPTRVVTYLTLAAADTAALVAAMPGKAYVGVWDVQLAPDGGGDPTTTLCRGKLTLAGDVTRGE